MTSKERVVAAIEYNDPDRLPVAEAFWEDTLAAWHKQGLPENVSLHRHFGFDIVEFGLDASPRFDAFIIDEDDEFVTLQDRFGYRAKKYRGKSRTLEYISHPVGSREDWRRVSKMFEIERDGLSRIDNEAFPFRTKPAPSWDEAHKKFVEIRDKEKKYILAGAYGPHEVAWRLHGFSDTLEDIALGPAFIRDISDTYCEFLGWVIDECLSHGIGFDGFFMIEDLGTTRGMMFSPDSWREIYRPGVEHIGELLRERDIHFWMHSCGNVEAVIDDLIECGLQVLNPLEVKSGLDIVDLKERYGEKLAYYGNIDVRAMAADDIRELEREIIRKAKAFPRGGFIAHSDHSVPPEVSYSRYLDMLELVALHGS